MLWMCLMPFVMEAFVWIPQKPVLGGRGVGLCCGSRVLAWRGLSQGGPQGNPSPLQGCWGWGGNPLGHTSGARAAHLGLEPARASRVMSSGSRGGTAGLHIWSWGSAKGEHIWLREHTWSHGNLGAGIWSQGSTSGAGKAHLVLAQHIWSQQSTSGCAAACLQHCSCSPAPIQPQPFPRRGVATPPCCWFPYVPAHHRAIWCRLNSCLLIAS